MELNKKRREAPSWTEMAAEIAEWITANQNQLNYDPRRTKPESVAAGYLAATQAAVIAGLRERSAADVRFGCYRVGRRSLRTAAGRYGPQRSYWWDLLHAQWPLFEEIRRGRPGLNKQQRELTLIKPMIAEITEYSTGSIAAEAAEASQHRERFDWITIDPVSLGHFIQQARSANYRRIAESILEKYHVNNQSFPQSSRTAASGRRYYQGLNLQTAPAVVRRAALGRHCEYDLNTSVYSWQLVALRLIDGLADAADPVGTSYTREYIANKKTIRQRLSHLMASAASSEERLRRVKQAITAIGFGARQSNAYYVGEDIVAHGLAGVILNAEDRQRFLSDSWVQGFLAEQTEIVTRIVAGYLAVCPENRTDPLFQHRGRFSPKRYVAQLYQRFETQVMQRVHALTADSEILLWVHDCVYTRRPINLEHVNSVLKLEFGDGIRLVSGHSDGTNQSVDPWTAAQLSPLERQQQQSLDRTAEELWHAAEGRRHSANDQDSSQLQTWNFKSQRSQEPGHYSGYYSGN